MKFGEMEKKVGALEKENVDLKIKMNTLQTPTELLENILSAQASSSVHQAPPQMPSQAPIPFEPPQMPNPALPEFEKSSRENLFSGLQFGHEEKNKSRPGFIELVGVRPRGEVPYRLRGEESYHPTGSTHRGEESYRPFIFPETPEEEETICFGRGNFRMVAPVEVSDNPGPNLLGQLGKEGLVPRFSGEPCEFDNFRWEFNRFITHLEKAHRCKIPEDNKLLLLEKALPEKEKRRIQVSQRQNDPVTCQSFLSQLAARFGTTRDTLLRKKWQDLAIKHSGKITIQDLHDFELDFRQIRQDLSDLTERECREHLLKKIAPSSHCTPH